MSRQRQAGIGLVSAIFLLVVLAALGVAMLTISTSQQTASALDVQGARAYQAARAGIEYGLYQQLRNNKCANTSFALPAGSALNGFSVTVTCTQTPPLTGADAQLDRWTIRAVGCNRSACPAASTSPDYVQRTIEVKL
jgi:MSHA biogenesis protein MshP